MGDFEGLGEENQFMNNFSSSATPRFKGPINISDLANSRRAVFEIDSSDDIGSLLDDDDDPSGYGPEEQPITDANPKSYAAKSKKQPFALNNMSDLSFKNLYDPDVIASMEVLEDGGVRKLIVKEGSGTFVPDGCKVFVHYIMCGEGEDEPFDSTVDRGYPTCLDFRDGGAGTIAGLYVAVKSMRVYEIAKFWIHHDFAYKELGCAPRIKPRMDVHCLIEVMDIIEENQLKLIPFMASDERQLLEFKEIYNAAMELRTTGNGEYTQLAYWGAVNKYKKSLAILEEYATINEEDQKTRQEAVHTIYLNLAQCYLKLNRNQQACVACHLALRSKDGDGPNHAKLYFRFAEAKFNLGQTEEAIRLNKEASRRNPRCPNILGQRRKLLERKAEEEKLTNATYSKMGAMFNSKPKPSEDLHRNHSDALPLKRSENCNAAGSRPDETKNVPTAADRKALQKQQQEKEKPKVSLLPPIEWEEYEQYEAEMNNLNLSTNVDAIKIQPNTSAAKSVEDDNGPRKLEIQESNGGLIIKNPAGGSGTLYDLVKPKLQTKINETKNEKTGNDNQN